MPAPSSTIELIDLVRKSGILPPDKLAARLQTETLPEDPAKSAALLVKQGVLTSFQAKLLLAGRYRGFRLGAYIVREQIGQGGMGAVYLAEHDTLRRRVAVKVLAPADGMNRVAVERFLREARAAAALDHPNIVRIFDVAQQGEMYFLAMEYVDGQTLDKLVEAGGPVACGRAVELMLQAASGLHHAYEKGFVHRDIKPGNLIQAKDGTLKILDMGLARSFEADDQLTANLDSGAVVGTADYISPEQAMNSPGLDIRADIYSLGATFFTLATGKPPFEGNTTQKLLQHQMKEPPSLAALDKTFPAGLAAVVAKMLKKKPADRYQTPADVIEALGPWLPNTQRVVQTLSRTNLNKSPAMMNTLAAVVSGSTGNLPKVAAPAEQDQFEEVPPPRRSRLPLFIAVGAGGLTLLTAVVVVAVLALSPGTKPDPGKQPPETATVINPPLVTPPRPDVVPAPADTTPRPAAPAPKLPGLVYQLVLAGRDEFFETGTTSGDPTRPGAKWVPDRRNGAGSFPPEWQPSTTASGGKYAARVRTDPPALAVAGQDGTAALFGPDLTLAGGAGQVTVSYQAAGEVVVSFRPKGGPAVAVDTLPATGTEAFATRSAAVSVPAGTTGRFEFAATVPGAAGFAVSGFTVTDAPFTGPALVRLDLSKQQPFVERTKNFKTPGAADLLTVESAAGPGKRPGAPWYRWVENKLAVAEFFADGEPGAVSYGVRMVTPDGGAQINTPALKGSPKRVRVRVLYQTGPTSSGARVRFKPESGSIWEAVTLPPTGGSWRLLVTDVDLAARKSGNGTFEIYTTGVGDDGALRLREFTVTAAE